MVHFSLAFLVVPPVCDFDANIRLFNLNAAKVKVANGLPETTRHYGWFNNLPEKPSACSEPANYR
jgi:hypothetical protein